MINLARHLLETLLIECNISAANSVRLAQIIVIALLLLLCYFIAWTFRKYAMPVILQMVEKTETKWDDYLVNRIKRYESTISLHISVHLIAFML